jgi:hypothetical protein
MPKAWILINIFFFLRRFFYCVEVSGKTLEVVVLVELQDESDERFKGVVWIGLLVFILKLNVLEIIGEGA